MMVTTEDEDRSSLKWRRRMHLDSNLFSEVKKSHINEFKWVTNLQKEAAKQTANTETETSSAFTPPVNPFIN